MASELRSPLKRLECPNCGSPLDQFNPTSQAIVCPKCGSHIAIGTETPSALSGKRGKIPPSPFPIKIGSTATIAGTEFVVLGRIVYRGWDDEDSWTWHEWLLGGNDGRMVWLSYDENGFGLFTKLRFRAPFNAESDRRLQVSEDKQAFIHERYPAEITGAEGELTWQAKQGDKLFVAEGAGGGKRYSIQQTPEELEVYEGRLISEAAIAAAFGDQDWLKRLDQAKNRKQTQRAVAVLCILFALLGLIFAAAVSGSGEELEPQFMTLDTTQLSKSFNVEFDKTNRAAVVAVALRNSGLPENSYVDLDINVTSPDGTKDELFTQELWHETGTDEDGFWRETHYEHSEMFVPFQTGTHTIEVVFEPVAGINSVDLAVTVRRNHIMPAWYVIYAAVAGAIGILSGLSGFKRATAQS